MFWYSRFFFQGCYSNWHLNLHLCSKELLYDVHDLRTNIEIYNFRDQNIRGRKLRVNNLRVLNDPA